MYSSTAHNQNELICQNRSFEQRNHITKIPRIRNAEQNVEVIPPDEEPKAVFFFQKHLRHREDGSGEAFLVKEMALNRGGSVRFFQNCVPTWHK